MHLCLSNVQSEVWTKADEAKNIKLVYAMDPLCPLFLVFQAESFQGLNHLHLDRFVVVVVMCFIAQLIKGPPPSVVDHFHARA